MDKTTGWYKQFGVPEPRFWLIALPLLIAIVFSSSYVIRRNIVTAQQENKQSSSQTQKALPATASPHAAPLELIPSRTDSSSTHIPTNISQPSPTSTTQPSTSVQSEVTSPQPSPVAPPQPITSTPQPIISPVLNPIKQTCQPVLRLLDSTNLLGPDLTKCPL